MVVNVVRDARRKAVRIVVVVNDVEVVVSM